MLQSPLSQREGQLLELAAQGLTDKEAAIAMAVSFGTLRTYWHRIRIKLGVRSRGEAIAQILRRQEEPVARIYSSFAAADVAMALIDPEERVVEANETFEQLAGGVDEGLRVDDVFSFEGQLRALQSVRLRTSDCRLVDLQADTFTHGGKKYTLLRVYDLIRQDQVSLGSSLSDVSADLYNRLPLFIWFGLPSGVIVYINRWWEEYSSVKPSHALLAGCGSVIHSKDVGASKDRWREACHRNEAYEAEARFYCSKDETFHRHRINMQPQRSSCGRVLGWLGTAYDLEPI